MTTLDEITYPVDLRKYIPSLTDQMAFDLVRDVENHLLDLEKGRGRRKIGQEELAKTAVLRLCEWYFGFRDCEDMIRRNGLRNFVFTYMRARVVITLQAFKDAGVTDLPL